MIFKYTRGRIWHWYGNKLFKYEICDYRFHQEGDFKKHVASVYKGTKQIKCEVREYDFSRIVEFENHAASLFSSWSKEAVQMWSLLTKVKVGNVLKGSNSIQSPSPSVNIQIMSGKVCFM